MQENDRLQGILFNAEDTIQFADASTASKRMIIKTRQMAHRMHKIKFNYHLPIAGGVLRPHSPGRLRSRDTTDVASRLKVQ